jgi:glutamyl-tRNA reductase
MLFLVGSNHRSAPVGIRERMAFPSDGLSDALARLLAKEGILEAMILSTCNRVEVLVRTNPGSTSGLAAVRDFLCAEHGLAPDELDRYCYQLEQLEVVRHVFQVASGLDSMIVGEPQILGQVKQAYRFAKANHATGPVLEHLLQHCLATAKRVRTETGISRHAVSVAYAAVELASKIFGKLEGRKALLLGAGKMSDLLARHLVSHEVAPLIVASRTYNRAVAAAERYGGRAVHWDDGLGQLSQVDIVVSCTGAARPILTKKDVARAMRARRSGALFLIDIAVPRDIETNVNDLDNVYLYDIDALEGVVAHNLDERREAARNARRAIENEVGQFNRWRQGQEVVPIIVSLRKALLGIGDRELERVRRKLGELDERQQRAVEELARGVIHKVLHRPIVHLRRSAERGDMLTNIVLYQEIFGLQESDLSSDDVLAEDNRSDEPDEPTGSQHQLLGGKNE